MLDLSYLEARVYLDERVEKDDKRRDDLSLVVTAPLGFVGLAVGASIIYWMWRELLVMHVYFLAIPLVLAGLFAVVPAHFVKKLFKPKQHAIELSLAETEVLESIDHQRRHQGVRPFAAEDGA